MTEKAKATLQKQETRLIPDVLYDFSVAVMGNSCRTLPAIMLQGHDEGTLAWLEAYQTRQGSWRLFQRRKDFSKPHKAQEHPEDAISPHDGFEQMEILPEPTDKKAAKGEMPEHFTLMDIMFRMAQFERENSGYGAEGLSLDSLKGHDAESLGHEHYKAFGIREGIAFDRDTGKPVPSFEGRIIGNGTFTDEMEAAVKAAWDAKVERYAKEGSYLDALRINAKPTHMLRTLYENLNKKRVYEEISDYFEENIFDIFRDCEQNGFDYKVQVIKEGTLSDTVPIGQALATIINDALNDRIIEKNYSDILTEDEIQNIRNALISMDIFRAVLHARWAIDAATANPELTEDSEAFVTQQMTDIQARYKRYGLQEVDDDLITRAILDRDSPQAMNIDNTIRRIQKDLKDLSVQAGEAAKRIQLSGGQDFSTSSRQNAGPK